MTIIEAKDATCTEAGNNAYYHCSRCDKYFKDIEGEEETTAEEETIPATGHNWNDGEITTAATCTTDGVMTYTCLDCNETRTETIAATGHKWDEGEITTAATCTEDGVMTFTCPNCNETRTETIPAGHVIVDGVCTVCGELIYTVGLEYELSSDKTYYIVTGIGTASGDIIIPDTHEGLPVTYIGYYAFYYCSSLTSIEIPAGVTGIGSSAFNGCSNLTGVGFAEGSQLTSIGDWAFNGCSNLTSIDIPAGVTTIGDHAFSGCSSLTSIEFPAGVTSIGEYAFYGCLSLTDVSFAEGSQLTNIGEMAFYGCSNLDTVYYSGSIENWFDIDFVDEYSNPLNNGAGLYIGGDLLTEVVVPESITTVGYQLTGCTSLTLITLHSGVTSIGYEAYYRCSNLESITFAEGSQLTSIGECAFYGCSSLTSIEIPAGVTELPDDVVYDGVFSGCSNLASVTFAEGSQLTSIGSYAFEGCSSLTSIDIPARVCVRGLQQSDIDRDSRGRHKYRRHGILRMQQP